MLWRANTKNAPSPEEIRNKIKQQKENNRHITAQEIINSHKKQANKQSNVNKISFEYWKKLGYSDEQSEELERLSHIGGDVQDVDINTMVNNLKEVAKSLDCSVDKVIEYASHNDKIGEPYLVKSNDKLTEGVLNVLNAFNV